MDLVLKWRWDLFCGIFISFKQKMGHEKAKNGNCSFLYRSLLKHRYFPWITTKLLRTLQKKYGWINGSYKLTEDCINIQRNINDWNCNLINHKNVLWLRISHLKFSVSLTLKCKFQFQLNLKCVDITDNLIQSSRSPNLQKLSFWMNYLMNFSGRFLAFPILKYNPSVSQKQSQKK